MVKILSCTYTAPRFAISPTSISVPEDMPHVEICIHVETRLFRNVVVTAQIGQNIGANHQATGILVYFIDIICLTTTLKKYDCVSVEISPQT